jgi:Uma2 family endonuclease
MSSVLKQQKITEEVFLEYLDSIDGKAEWLDGEIYDMAGGSGRHSQICSTMGRLIGNALLGKGCITYSGDLMYRIPTDRSLCFPDASVICGPPIYELPREDIATNPTLIVEVLSKETEKYCRMGKFMKYGRIASLQEYVLVDQYEYAVEVRFRHPSGLWEIQIFDEIEQNVPLQSLGISLAMAEIYRDVVFG